MHYSSVGDILLLASYLHKLWLHQPLGYGEAAEIRKQSMEPTAETTAHCKMYHTKPFVRNLRSWDCCVDTQQKRVYFIFILFLPHFPIGKPGNSRAPVCPRSRGKLVLLCALRRAQRIFLVNCSCSHRLIKDRKTKHPLMSEPAESIDPFKHRGHQNDCVRSAV